MFEKKNLLIGGGILLGLYLLNPFAGVSHTLLDDATFSYQTENLKIVNFVGNIEYELSPDDAIHIEATNIHEGFQPNFDHIAGKLEISNFENISKINCNNHSWFWWKRSDEGSRLVSINGGGSVELSQFPKLKIMAPKATLLAIDKSLIHGEFSQVKKLDLTLLSCGELNFGGVEADAKISLKGSGKVNIGSIGGSVNASIRGSGDIKIGKVAQDSISYIQGSGDIDYGTLNGIHKMNIQGSGDIEVKQMYGDAELHLQGSGDIEIEDGDLNWLIATVQGSGDIEFGGVAVNRQFKVKGSGEIKTNYD